jgi:glycosyltransferase involved in cell wall biosynthesis
MIALDLSRLLSRARYATPTGIDRVELAYARHLAADNRPHVYTARNALGGIGLLPEPTAAAFIAAVADLWRDGGSSQERRRVAGLARYLRHAALLGAIGLGQAMKRSGTAPVYLLTSHQNLDRSGVIARLKMATGARFVCLIHDLIPLEQPDLARPGQHRKHRRRIAATAAMADAVVVNSAATAAALRAWGGIGPRSPPVVVAALGVDLPQPPTPHAGERPYFVCIGTIEARKNQRLLLDLWRRLAAELEERSPLLVLVGRRGYGGQAIVRPLSALAGLVVEHTDMPDIAMAALLRGAQALLLPSLAEGFGLPVAEALTLGVPVLCSDRPALRETGGDVPEYLDPADANAWRQAVLDYMPGLARRQAQLARLAGWRAPRWDAHFAIVDRLIDALG